MAREVPAPLDHISHPVGPIGLWVPVRHSSAGRWVADIGRQALQTFFKMCFSVVYVFQSILILSGVRLSSSIYWQGNYIDYLHIFGTKMLLQRLDSDKINMIKCFVEI